jgi:hypothetical protein
VVSESASECVSEEKDDGDNDDQVRQQGQNHLLPWLRLLGRRRRWRLSCLLLNIPEKNECNHGKSDNGPNPKPHASESTPPGQPQ